MAVTVFLELNAQPAQADALKALFKEILPDTRAYDGCIGVEVVDNQDDKANIVLVESWESRGQYEKYLGWRQETGFVDKLGGFLAGPPSIRYFDKVDA